MQNKEPVTIKVSKDYKEDVVIATFLRKLKYSKNHVRGYQ